MLAVVVDDYDMGVTHVIRGDDHLANAARQSHIYHAMDWELPTYAHIPLIHGPDGKKLSKRHGATGLEEYQEMGYLAAGMRNYLARLGWSHGDDEFFSDAQALEWFNTAGIGKSPSRLDFKKLDNICGQHFAAAEDAALLHELGEYRAAKGDTPFSAQENSGLLSAMYCLKERAKKFDDLIDKAHFILTETPINPDEKSAKSLDNVSRGILKELTPQLQNVSWKRETLEALVAQVAEAHETKLGKLAAPLRAALAGRTATPSVFDMMLVLGRDETIARLEQASR
jgi:glutamyl-tRNA synthetase